MMAAIGLSRLRSFRPVFNPRLLQYRSSYVILVPEIPPDDATNNSLFRLDEYPDFNEEPATKAYFALGKRMLEFESNVEKLEAELSDTKLPKRPETVLDPLERLVCPLDYAWSAAKNMYICRTDLMPSSSYVPLHDRVRRVRASKFTSLPIYHAVKEMKADEDVLKLTDSQRRVADKYILEAKLNGIELSGKKKDQLTGTLTKLEAARSDFKLKAQAALGTFKHYITDTSLVRDFPEDLLKAMAVNGGDSPEIGPWKVTLQPVIYNRFLEYCPDRVQRWNAHQAEVTLCAAHINQELNHSITLEDIRSHRRDLAKLLGYETYVDMSMETKMAGNMETVQSMIATLLLSAKSAQEEELDSLTKFASDRGFKSPLELWDVPYWRRKQRRTLTPSVGDVESLKDFFPLEVVFRAALSLCQDLFGVVFVDATETASVWNPDTRFFKVIDEASGREIGAFYFDPYMRPGQKLYTREDASWMIGMRQRSDLLRTKPIASLITNFPKPGNNPCCLTLQQVELLFERLGEVLQHVLTEASYSEVSGTNNIEWDAAKSVPDFFKQWLKEPRVLQQISSNVQTGDGLTYEQAEEVAKISNFMAGYDLTRELYISTLDLEMYSTNEFWIDVVRRLWPKFFPFERMKKDVHPCSLYAIFSDEWAAAYYSHIWSRMIAADSFNALKEVGLENKDEVRRVGRRFRESFLALGGSCHPSEVFRRFRGRDPSPEALLIALGLKKLERSVN